MTTRRREGVRGRENCVPCRGQWPHHEHPISPAVLPPFAAVACVWGEEGVWLNTSNTTNMY